MDETMQLAQNIVRDMFCRTCFTVEINRNIRIAKAQLTDEDAQVFNRTGDVFGRIDVELLVVNRQDKGAGAALLLGKRAQITVTGDTNDLHAFRLDRSRQRANTETRGVFRAVILVDDKDGKAKFHPEDSAKNR